jgi:hypothetical protein
VARELKGYYFSWQQQRALNPGPSEYKADLIEAKNF